MNLSTIKAEIVKLSPEQRLRLQHWLNEQGHKRERPMSKPRGKTGLSRYASFDLKGYRFEAFIPGNAKAPREFTLVITKDCGDRSEIGLILPV